MNRLEVYYNLHKQCLSMRRMARGARVSHAHTLLLNDCLLVVQPAGREKVRREGKKNVHAFVRGYPAFIRRTWADDDGDLSVESMERQGYQRITYNPYKYDSFVLADTGQPIYRASQVALIGRQMYLTGRI